MRYFKIRFEADDNDDSGQYRVEVVRASGRTSPPVHRPTLRTPPILGRSDTTIHDRPDPHHRGHYRNGETADVDTDSVSVGVNLGGLWRFVLD